MINVAKRPQVPASLEARTSWRGEDVQLALQEDFFNKCYICEDEGITSINVEHFIPHRGDPNLMYAWDNLFFACGHCNGIKHDKPRYDGILNCTNPAHRVADWIKYSYDESDFSRLNVTIDELVAQEGVTQTVALLMDVYHSDNTVNKRMQSKNLRKRLQKELAEFNNALSQYYLDGNLLEEDRLILRGKIISHLQISSAFCAFKIWVIRSKQRFLTDFGQNIPQ